MKWPIVHVLIFANQMSLKDRHLEGIMFLIECRVVGGVCETKICLIIAILFGSKFDHFVFFSCPWIDQQNQLFLTICLYLIFLLNISLYFVLHRIVSTIITYSLCL